MIATDKKYGGCSKCGSWETRPEVFECVAILVHVICNFWIACEFYHKGANQEFSETSLQYQEMVVGLSELVIGGFGLFMRYQGQYPCDSMFTFTMMVLGADTLLDALHEADVLYLIPYLWCHIIFLICLILSFFVLVGPTADLCVGKEKVTGYDDH